MQAAEAAPTEALSVTLRMDQDTRSQLEQSLGLVATAEGYVVDSALMAEEANGELRNVIERKKKIEAIRKGFVAPAQQIIENARALFNPALAALERAEGTLKVKLADWTKREQDRVAAEQRRADEAARKARQEAEAKAAAERAKAEERAREERRKAEEAEAARKKAEAEGNARAAAAAAAAKAKAEEAAKAATENGERKAQEAQLSAAAQPAATIEAAATPSGFLVRDNWVAELDPACADEDAAKALVVKAIASGRTELLSLIDLNMAAAKKMAGAQTKHFNVPGLVSVNRPIPVSRKK